MGIEDLNLPSLQSSDTNRKLSITSIRILFMDGYVVGVWYLSIAPVEIRTDSPSRLLVSSAWSVYHHAPCAAKFPFWVGFRILILPHRLLRPFFCNTDHSEVVHGIFIRLLGY